MLQTALEQLHITDSIISVVRDDATEITTAITKALAKADLVLLTGGVSVGNYDFVVEACGKAGVAQLFHKVAQRPGKPLYCGRREHKIIFGLPGNPASVLSCFYTFVIVALEELSGRKNLVERRQVPLLADFSKKIALTQFLKATCTGEGVRPLQAQESFRLSSFAVANCLLVLPEEKREYHAGEMVETLLLPNV
jgi:molybdopterin molybdotransferase